MQKQWLIEHLLWLILLLAVIGLAFSRPAQAGAVLPASVGDSAILLQKIMAPPLPPPSDTKTPTPVPPTNTPVPPAATSMPTVSAGSGGFSARGVGLLLLIAGLILVVVIVGLLVWQRR